MRLEDDTMAAVMAGDPLRDQATVTMANAQRRLGSMMPRSTAARGRDALNAMTAAQAYQNAQAVDPNDPELEMLPEAVRPLAKTVGGINMDGIYSSLSECLFFFDINTAMPARASWL